MPDPDPQLLEALFCEALEKESPDERTAFLDAACADDPDLRTQVEALLDVHGRLGSFLDTPPVSPPLQSSDGPDPDATLQLASISEKPGSMIGRYKIIQEIGEGGFGTVFMAEQERPVRRVVALKIIKLGMDTRQVIARFEAERQALALMDHPNIARVLDAGATETGRPYFVMELVRGVSITEYCNENKLTVNQRLELFLRVCNAIQHAHQKGVIHRDLKPSNVLVTPQDGLPVPKVIDFGIAKATSQRLTEKTLFTEMRQFIGTPEYMSPDQAQINGLDVDTRTDVYSLGVLLYELLTGTTPFDGKKLRKMSYEEIRRTIREVEPPRPSARVRVGTANEGFQCGLEPSALARALQGDLDWIVMQAMAKDRTRRYATAKGLADDIERSLAREPVSAGPPGAVYKSRKFIQRHRIGVVVGVLVGLVIVVGFSLATVGLISANRSRAEMRVERDAADTARTEAEAARINEQEQRKIAEASAAEARRQAVKSETLNTFLQDMLRSVGPSRALGREVSVRYILDETARKIDEGALADQPEVEASLRLTLGETYEALGVNRSAEAHLQRAVELLGQIFGGDHTKTLRAKRTLARVLRSLGRYDSALALLQKTVEVQRRVLGEDDPETLATLSELGQTLAGSGQYDKAEPMLRRVLDDRRRVLGADHADTLESMCALGMACRASGATDEAELLLQQALARSQRAFGDEHPCTIRVMSDLGRLVEDKHQYNDAEALYRHVYEVDRKILGVDHPHTVLAMNDLLRVLRKAGKTQAIRPLVGERLERLKRIAEQPGARALALHAYAWELLSCEFEDMRDPEAALPLARRAVELDEGHDANMLVTLAQAYEATGDLEDAIGAQSKAVEIARRGGPYNIDELEARLTDYRILKGDPTVIVLNPALMGFAGRVSDALLPGAGPGSAMVTKSEELAAQSRYDEAVAALQSCLALRRKAWPEGHWLIPDTLSRLGGVLAAAGRFDEAEPYLLDAWSQLDGNPKAPLSLKRDAVDRLISLYETLDRRDAVEQWQRILDSLQTRNTEGG